MSAFDAVVMYAAAPMPLGEKSPWYPTQPSTTLTVFPDYDERFKALEKRIANLEAKLEQAPLAAEVKALRETLMEFIAKLAAPTGESK